MNDHKFRLSKYEKKHKKYLTIKVVLNINQTKLILQGKNGFD